MSLVLDSSAALAWAYVEERTPAIKPLIEGIEAEGAWVPSLWRLEVGNSLQMSLRRGRQDLAQRDGVLFDLSQCPIQIDNETHDRAWSTILQLAEKHRVTMYYAAYLELADRRSLPLPTLDKDLRQAAQAENVYLLGMD